MINPIEHVRAVYRSKQPIRRVKILRLTNYDFMKNESPFTTGEAAGCKGFVNSFPTQKSFWQRVKQYIYDKNANSKFLKRIDKLWV